MTTKKFCLLALICLQISCAFAQDKAPNYFQANSEIFKYRLAEIRNDYSTYYYYEYDDDNYLLNERCTDENGTYISDTRYYYNQDGYMIRSEQWRLADNGEPIMAQLNEYTRDESGYITQYSRSTLHGEDPNDPTLTEDVRIELQYNNEFQLSNASISFYYDLSGTWLKGKETFINYLNNNLIHEIIQYVDNEELSRETLEYNEAGKISSYHFTGSTGTYDYTYLYDDDSNIQKAGYDSFWFEYQYNTEYLSSETFLPRRTLAELVYFGFQDFTFKGLPYDNSRNAVIKEELSGAEMVYEEVNITGLTQHDASKNDLINLCLSNNTLNINISEDLIGENIKIFDIHGVCLKTINATDKTIQIDVSSYSKGCYIISAGKEMKKFVR